MRIAAALARDVNGLGCRWRRLSRCRRIIFSLLAALVVLGAWLGCWWWTSWPVQIALQQPGDYWPLAFSPDGATLLTTGWRKDITVWDVAEGRKRATWAC